ncbi:MAG: EAL domain-containing protein [Acidimicrobiia bacterium]|nr:EAL domain-containing protein [Acidimicrobiia bacterium]
MTVAGPDGLLSYVSPASERLLGLTEDELLGFDLMEHVHPDDAERIVNEISSHVITHGAVGPLEFRVRHRDSSWRYLEAIGLNLLDDPAVGGIIFNCRDITERKAFEHDLAFQATHDSLTGLPNRALLLDRLGQAIARSTRGDGRPLVLFIDLDRFKFVNDSLGHGAGDRLLSKVADRIRGAVRPGDTVARFGGDEFVVLAEGIEEVAECDAIADRLSDSLATPFILSGQEVFVSASIGMRLARSDHENPETLLRDADSAMYRAKERGRSRTEWFDEQTHWRTVDRLATENALHRALDRDELRLHYQPQHDLVTGRMVGVEGLLRWSHPERGLVGPADFIELAEETGLIVPIGEWVLHEACRQGRRWQRQSPSEEPFVVSVNLSAHQIARPDLTDVVARALDATGFPAESLCLEITEGALMQDVATTVQALRSLKALGVRLSIDDFGTGHASLGHLKQFPVDSLKIDRTFVDGLGVVADDQVIVAAVIGLAHALGITAIAEGVETPAQLAELRALRCDAAQGYLFSRPVEAAELGDIHAVSIGRADGRAGNRRLL